MNRPNKGITTLLIIFIIIILTGCNTNDDNNEIKSKARDDANTNPYEFETEKITVLRWKDDALQDNELEVACDIEDKDIIEKIINALKSEEWEEVSLEEKIKAVPEYYISFNNGTMIKLLGDISYGHIMNYTMDDGLYDYLNSRIYNFPEEFLNLIIAEVNKNI